MNSNDEIEPSDIKKRILAKNKVQKEMDDLRVKIKELRKQQDQGRTVQQDIEAYLDYLKVLKKERDSIREGNHTTFLDAKKLISPKLNYGSKKEDALAKIRKLAQKIRATEKALAGGGYDSAQREELELFLRSTKDKHQDALLELKSIEQYNHTRFLEQKELEKGKNEEDENGDEPSLQIKPPEVPIGLLKKPEPPQSTSGDSIKFNPPPMI